ncbi:efflux RND transporter periplasmic adaptor subunit [Acetivibrio cellulolyticus]
MCIILAMTLMLSGCGSTASTLSVSKNTEETVTIKKGEMQNTIDEIGTVVFDDVYNITSLTSGRILSADFKEGDKVSEGQVLYTIDSTEITNQIQATKISLEKASESLRQYKNAAADLGLFAKASGMVTKVYINKGDFVNPGTPIADIVDSNMLKLTVPFNLPANSGIHEGTSAEVILADSGLTVYGTVSKVYESSQAFDDGTSGVNVEIHISNPGAVKEGNQASAKIGAFLSLTSEPLKNRTNQSIVSTQSGEVENIYIREGSRVSVGTKIVQLKNSAVTNAINTAAISVKEISNSLSQLESKLGDYVIKSPIKGIVVNKYSKTGDIASALSPLSTIADTGRLYVDVDIDELYIKQISKGQKTKVLLEYGDTEYSGKVYRINDSGTEKNGVTYYTVRIALDNPEGLIDGMNVNVRIITGVKANAAYLPLKAVDNNTVKVKEGNKTVERDVKTGIKTKEYIEILEGLKPDDQVVIKLEK